MTEVILERLCQWNPTIRNGYTVCITSRMWLLTFGCMLIRGRKIVFFFSAKLSLPYCWRPSRQWNAAKPTLHDWFYKMMMMISKDTSHTSRVRHLPWLNTNLDPFCYGVGHLPDYAILTGSKQFVFLTLTQASRFNHLILLRKVPIFFYAQCWWKWEVAREKYKLCSAHSLVVTIDGTRMFFTNMRLQFFHWPTEKYLG